MPLTNGVTENGEVSKPLMDGGIEMSSMENNATDKRTRFQVNKVNADNKDIQISVDDDDEDRDAADDNLLTGNDKARLNSDTAHSSDTKYGKSFRHFTREALPRLDNYRNIMSIQAAYRPTLDELHNATLPAKPTTVQGGAAKAGDSDLQVKFGWIQGVLVRCLLNIWGVMLFLRLSWVVGQAGIGEAMLLILTTTAVTTITALSMSAISTNGVIKGGGTYYMISRSLGPEFGGSIGIIFSLANAVACAMYVVGFCESMTDLLKSFDLIIIDGNVQDIRIIGSITIVVLTVIVVVGMEWEAKTQLGLLVILLVAIMDFVIGSFVGPTSDVAKARGFLGYDLELLKENFYPDYRNEEGVNHSFFSVFAIFFPAATGILAGANISGDLRDPQKAIPKGTLLAIFITTISYLLMAFIAGFTMTRDASGNVEDFLNGTFRDCLPNNCSYGLHNNSQVIELVSWFGPIIYAGCFAATLSSALASLVSAPKVFQALCKDKLYPYIEWFGRGYGQNNEPVRGYVLTFIIAMAFILIGELNAIAPLISNFFLAAYTLINFSTFHASLAKPVGWRPTFKYYNMWLSLAGSILCVGVMFLISWATALITLSALLALYLIVAYRKPDVNWGSTTQAQTYKNALQSVQQLNSVEEHVKNYRPQILVLSGMPSSRPALIDFSYLLTKNLSLLICGHINENPLSQRVRNVFNYKSTSWLKAHKVKAFYSLVDGANFEDGAKALLQASGIGKLRPNILLLGYKSDWPKTAKDNLNIYFDIIHKALDMHLSVGILRLQTGLDCSHIIHVDEDGQINEQSILNNTRTRNNSTESLPRNQSYTQMSQATPTSPKPASDNCNMSASSTSDISAPNTPIAKNKEMIVNVNPTADTDSNTNKKKKQSNQGSKSDVYHSKNSSDFPKDVLNQITFFQRKQKKGTIDVWWLYDDGGLTLLLPYIISTRRNWSNCKLRVFALANKQDELEFEHRNMASLLAKFRIDYSDLQVIPDITKKPQESTQAFFDSLIAEFSMPEVDGDADTAAIPETEILAMRDKTNRHLRLRELLLEHSLEASMVVMTLPMPRKNMISSPLYMAWLELLTRDMPPFLLVRGNQTSVLTFYS